MPSLQEAYLEARRKRLAQTTFHGAPVTPDATTASTETKVPLANVATGVDESPSRTAKLEEMYTSLLERASASKFRAGATALGGLAEIIGGRLDKAKASRATAAGGLATIGASEADIASRERLGLANIAEGQDETERKALEDISMAEHRGALEEYNKGVLANQARELANTTERTRIAGLEQASTEAYQKGLIETKADPTETAIGKIEAQRQAALDKILTKEGVPGTSWFGGLNEAAKKAQSLNERYDQRIAELRTKIQPKASDQEIPKDYKFLGIDKKTGKKLYQDSKGNHFLGE